MNEHEIYEIGYKYVCKEIGDITEQIQKNASMSDKDLERLDKLYHIKKSMLTVKAMTDAEEYGKDGVSGRRMMSRDAGNTSYTEGYSDGYSEAMRQMDRTGGHEGTSGHYYPMTNYYPTHRW